MPFVGSIDLGSGFSCDITGWHPDRELNPQYEGIPDVEQMGLIIYREGSGVGHVYFDLPEVRATGVKGPFWTLVSLDPLHIEPSIQMYEYKDGEHVPSYHGFIRNGKWESA